MLNVDTPPYLAAFEHVRTLVETHEDLIAIECRAGGGEGAPILDRARSRPRSATTCRRTSPARRSPATHGLPADEFHALYVYEPSRLA